PGSFLLLFFSSSSFHPIRKPLIFFSSLASHINTKAQQNRSSYGFRSSFIFQFQFPTHKTHLIHLFLALKLYASPSVEPRSWSGAVST
ncbi:hypothetical protein CFP56_040544, partial [Quercus suber]